MKPIDNLLNNVTMYRLLIYVLGGLLGLALLFGLLGTLPVQPLALGAIILAALAGGLAADLVLPRLYHAPANHGSSLITSLILACILTPSTKPAGIVGVALAATLAVASKYVIAWRGQHIANPAAMGAFLIGLVGLSSAGWWIGNPTMLPFTVIAALLILRKLRYWHLAGAFGLTALILLLAEGFHYGDSVGLTLSSALVSGPLLFFAAIMLTEPSTMPVGRRRQLVYGGVIGVLYALQISVGPISAKPEVALVLGNICFFAAAPKQRARLKLIARRAYGRGLEDLEFEPDRPLRFDAGQYMYWTEDLPGFEARGNRRTFTIGSSPTEKTVHLGVRYYEPSSAFKQRLRTMPLGSVIDVSQIGGDFVLPADTGQKLLFVAGGIGITPFRSMAAYMADSRQKRDAVLYYLVRDKSEVMYSDVWKKAAAFGLRTEIVEIPGRPPTGEETAAALRKAIPDIAERRCYIAGPDAMVRSYKRSLAEAGVARRAVITDYFSGY